MEAARRVSENLLVVDLNVSLWPVGGNRMECFFLSADQARRKKPRIFFLSVTFKAV